MLLWAVNVVCHVCHCEIHEEIIKVPQSLPKFDESFLDYKKLEISKDILTPCPVCAKMKAPYLKNCSLECAGRSRSKLDWDKIDLQKELKTKSIVQLAEELGCSDGAIHKRMKKIGLK